MIRLDVGDVVVDIDVVSTIDLVDPELVRLCDKPGLEVLVDGRIVVSRVVEEDVGGDRTSDVLVRVVVLVTGHSGRPSPPHSKAAMTASRRRREHGSARCIPN